IVKSARKKSFKALTSRLGVRGEPGVALRGEARLRGLARGLERVAQRLPLRLVRGLRGVAQRGHLLLQARGEHARVRARRVAAERRGLREAILERGELAIREGRADVALVRFVLREEQRAVLVELLDGRAQERRHVLRAVRAPLERGRVAALRRAGVIVRGGDRRGGLRRSEAGARREAHQEKDGEGTHSAVVEGRPYFTLLSGRPASLLARVQRS